MEEKRPLILISNDDGYQAKGINCLVDMLKDLADVVVCAPEDARSGFSCAFSATTPLRLTLRRQEEGVQVWSSNGTPVDCVKLALARIVERQPDMVVGGINHGDNGSVNAHYSGTMGVVLEGCMKYIPSVAFSLCDHRDDADFSPLRPIIRDITQRVLREGLPQGVCLNVNFPLMGETEKRREERGERRENTGDSRQETVDSRRETVDGRQETGDGRQETGFRGVRICRMARGRWVNEITTCHHPRGYDYHWMVGHYQNDEPQADDTDNWALTHGYVAITPTQIDVTAHQAMDQLRAWVAPPVAPSGAEGGAS